MLSRRSQKSSIWANAEKKLMKYDETEINMTACNKETECSDLIKVKPCSTYDAEEHKQNKDKAEHEAKSLKKQVSFSKINKQKETNTIDPKSVKAVKELQATERVHILYSQFAKVREELASITTSLKTGEKREFSRPETANDSINISYKKDISKPDENIKEHANKTSYDIRIVTR